MCFMRKNRGVWGVNFIIQSDVQDPNYISERTDEFLEKIEPELMSMTQEKFQEIRDSVRITVNVFLAKMNSIKRSI